MDEANGAGYLSMPTAEFGFPGPVRDRLVGAILDGRKVRTASLLIEYEKDLEPLPVPGNRAVVIDSRRLPVAMIETTTVLVVPLCHVDMAHARDEGEGFTTIGEWRAAHEAFWHSQQMLAALD